MQTSHLNSHNLLRQSFQNYFMHCQGLKKKICSLAKNVNILLRYMKDIWNSLQYLFPTDYNMDPHILQFVEVILRTNRQTIR